MPLYFSHYLGNRRLGYVTAGMNLYARWVCEGAILILQEKLTDNLFAPPISYFQSYQGRV